MLHLVTAWFFLPKARHQIGQSLCPWFLPRKSKFKPQPFFKLAYLWAAWTAAGAPTGVSLSRRLHVCPALWFTTYSAVSGVGSPMCDEATADFVDVWHILHIDAAIPCQHSQLSESVSTDSVIVWTPGCIKQVLNITFVGNSVLIFHNWRLAHLVQCAQTYIFSVCHRNLAWSLDFK